MVSRFGQPGARGESKGRTGDWVTEVDRRSEGSVWTDGDCTAYYLDPGGRNYALYPGFAAEFRRRTRQFDPKAYELAA